MDEDSLPGGAVVRSLGARADRRFDGAAQGWPLGRLGGADYISLAALLAAWAAALLLASGEPNWGLVATFAAYGFDKLDGFYARTYGEPSEFGRRLDSAVDVFVYLVTGALLFHVAVSPHPLASAAVGFLLLAFGSLRLIRHADEGFGTDGDTSYYVGLTVVHANLAVVANYFLVALVPWWSGWLAAATVAAVCPLQCSGYKSYKTTLGHALAGGLGLVAAALALAMEFGVVGGA